MSDQPVGAYLDPPLLAGPTGDVLAARAVAANLLLDCGHGFADLARPLLILTAALLHCSIVDGEGAWRTALSSYLTNLCEVELEGASLSNSALQFVRYAAAELQSLPPADRRKLLLSLKFAVSPPVTSASDGASKAKKMAEK